MKRFPPWLIYIASIGLGFFAFVIAGGVLTRIVSPVFSGLFVMLLVTLLSLVAAYFAFKYSRRFMSDNISRTNGESGEALDASEARKKRIAMSLFFSGTVLFPVFIFVFLSSIINLYV